MPYYPLGVTFSDSQGSVERHVKGARDAFNESIGKRLFHLQPATVVRNNLPPNWPARFKDTLLIGDGHPKSCQKSGIFVIQRITWMTYKSDNVFLYVICKLFNPILLLILLSHFVLGISPDGIIQMRSAVYGGQSGEVTTIINNSGIVECLQGNTAFPPCPAILHTTCPIAAMGYLEGGEDAEPIPVLMYDGAAGRADVGPRVSFVKPSHRFQDGAQLEVCSLHIACHHVSSQC